MSVTDKRICVANFIGQHKTSSLIRWSSLSASSYYYQSKLGKRGRSPSSHTLLTDGNIISNESIVIAIRFILAEEFVCFGYDKITDDLRANQFIINPKKTYRLMKEHKLLCGFRITEDSKNKLWLATFNGVTCLQPDGEITNHLKENVGPNKFFTHVVEDYKNRIYAMGFAGLYIQKNESWEKIDSVNRFLFALKGNRDTTWFMKEDELFITTSADSIKPIFFALTVH